MNKKRTAEKFGRLSETLAAWSLRLKGYRIIARGFRSPVGEIDIIARRGGVLVFVEVKARRNINEAADAVRAAQTGRIIRASGAYLQAHPSVAGLDQRFDVILVSPWRWPVHLVDAWRPEF